MIEELKEKVLAGGQVSREEALSLARDGDKQGLYRAAGEIRDRRVGRGFDTCSIINARSGKCSENCKWCAQSAHFHTHIEEYDLVDESTCLQLAAANSRYGVGKFSFVTSGRTLSDRNVERICHYAKEIGKQFPDLHLCASMGLLRKEQLQRLQHEVIDLEDMHTGVSIMDLGLNEFRLDLLAYLKDNPDVEHTPFGLHAIAHAKKDTPPSVIFVLKSRKEDLPVDIKNRLHPFYMVYIAADGSVVINHLSPKELLDRFRLLCKGQSVPDKEACRTFNKETKDGIDMSYYSQLLNEAVKSIVQTKEVSDIDSFLEGSQVELFAKRQVELDDFELIDFLVIK